MEWYLKVMRDNYANFKGRARRKEYWMFTLFFILFFTASIFVAVALRSFFLAEETFAILAGIILIALYFGHLVPALAVTVRRLHDTGKSGWFYLLAFIPYIGGLIIFIFTVIEGDKGDNKYGPDPKA